MLPRLVLCLIDSSGTAGLEGATAHIQQVVLTTLKMRNRYLAESLEVFVAAEMYTAEMYTAELEIEPLSCFNMQRSQRARTHVNRAFWNARINLLHAAAMSGADDVVQFLLAIASQRTNNAVLLLKAGTSIGRGRELALDGGELELIRLILAHHPVTAKRPIESDVGPPTFG